MGPGSTGRGRDIEGEDFIDRFCTQLNRNEAICLYYPSEQKLEN
jgi:hypothetical protein